LTWTDKKNRAFADGELCSCKIPFWSIAEALDEAKGLAQPIDRRSQRLLNN
jgi:hypothetical protein